MAEEGTLCTREDVLKKAGANASATSAAEGYTNVFIKQAEGLISAITRYDWVTNYASVSDIGKEALRQATSSLAAVYVINYDMSGFFSKINAQVMIDINYNAFVDVMNILKDDKGRAFVIAGNTD